MSIAPIEDAVAWHPRTAYAGFVKQAEAKRSEIRGHFPLDAWPDLPLERYALGQEDPRSTFCWWLEWGSPELGSISGGSSYKFMIFRRKKTGEWVYNEKFSSVEEAWQTVRGGYVESFRLAKEGRWDELDRIDALYGGPIAQAKSLHIYFPDDVLSVYSRNHLQHFLRLLGKPEGEENTYDVIRLNQALLSALREIPQLSDWAPIELGKFLYHWADPRLTKRIFKIAPGEDAQYWSECKAGGYICVGWDDVGDLREFDSKQEFRTRFDEVFSGRYDRSKLTKKANELWSLMQLQPGDIVIANQGTSTILATGEVVEPGYEWNPERAEFKHTARVKWGPEINREIPPQNQWAFVTIAEIPPERYAKLIEGESQRTPLTPPPPVFSAIESALERKGQLILYGPPGTGKTYTARRFSVWWLLKHAGREDADAAIADPAAFVQEERRLSTVQVARRVWWVVANPKEWSWDQLLKEKTVTYRYGRLQRNYPLVQPGDLVVGYQSTPDKRIVMLARVKRGLFTDDEGEPGIELEFRASVPNGPSYDELQSDPLLSSSEPMRFRNQGTLFALTDDEAEHLLALMTERNPDLPIHTDQRDNIGPLTRITFHPSYSYEDFIEGFRPVDKGEGTLALRLEDGVFKRICREAQANPKRRYLLLIDEINRANIAKVFGELITLLEYDKRDLVLTLPQSKEAFAIPPNVFVLGTMNTADRSIKLLDAALRRRFAFFELMPDAELLRGAKVESLGLDDFLEGLNRRIAETEGREKQIGHSFLLGRDGAPVSDADEFAERFRQEILPLLQEYCYEDYSALARYLGDQLVDEEAQMLNMEILGDASALATALEAEFTRQAEG